MRRGAFGIAMLWQSCNGRVWSNSLRICPRSLPYSYAKGRSPALSHPVVPRKRRTFAAGHDSLRSTSTRTGVHRLWMELISPSPPTTAPQSKLMRLSAEPTPQMRPFSPLPSATMSNEQGKENNPSCKGSKERPRGGDLYKNKNSCRESSDGRDGRWINGRCVLARIIFRFGVR